MLLLIGQQSEMLPHSRPSSLQDTRVKQLLPWIDANLERNLSIKEIAAVINVCPRVASGFSVSIFIVRPWNIFRRNGCSWQPKSLFPLIFP